MDKQVMVGDVEVYEIIPELVVQVIKGKKSGTATKVDIRKIFVGDDEEYHFTKRGFRMTFAEFNDFMDDGEALRKWVNEKVR